MDRYRVKVLPRAAQELDEIYPYICYNKLAPEVAKKQINRRTKVRITKSEISMRTWRSPMSATPQGAFVDIPEISLCDISYIIKKSILDLGLFPKAHQEILEGRFAGKGYRQLLVDNYIVIFRIDENQRIVYVVTIPYYGRNI